MATLSGLAFGLGGSLVALPQAAQATIAFVQNSGTAQSKTTDTSISIIVPPAGVTAGNRIIVTFAMDEAAGEVSTADSAGSTYRAAYANSSRETSPTLTADGSPALVNATNALVCDGVVAAATNDGTIQDY